MNRKDVKRYYRDFTLFLLDSLLQSINLMDEKIFENILVGELLEKYLDALNAGINFLKQAPTEFKTKLIKEIEKKGGDIN